MSPPFIIDEIVIPPAVRAHPDAGLIDLCDRFIAAYGEWEAALNDSDQEEGDGPECRAHEAEYVRLAGEIEQQPASTVDGVLAQLRAYARAVRDDNRYLGPDSLLLKGALRSLSYIDRARP